MVILAATLAPLASPVASGEPSQPSSPQTTLTTMNLPHVQVFSGSDSTPPLVFGVYPGGGCGEYPSVPQPDAAAVNATINDLAGSGQFAIHLYTAWSWHTDQYLDDLVARYGTGQRQLTITVKYSPPAGHDGDVDGYLTFVRGIVARYGANPTVKSFVIGNEPNAYGNKEASDGPFLRSSEAVARGVVAAADEARRRGYSSRIGFNFAVTSASADSAFLATLPPLGGAGFQSSVSFVGITLYPGTWRPGTGDPSADMLDGLTSARAAIDSVAALKGRPIEIREIGAPFVDEATSARYLSGFVSTTLAQRKSLGVSAFLWFDLWDANTAAPDAYAHYGLRRSDLSLKPAYGVYKQAAAAAQP